MPVQAAQWTDFLSCPICYQQFNGGAQRPVSLGCSHTVCLACLHKLHRKACPFDQTPIATEIDSLPVNGALLQLVGVQIPDVKPVSLASLTDVGHYETCKTCVEELALYLKPISTTKGVAPSNPSALSRPMQRKLVTLVNCQLVEEEGRVRAVRAGRSLGERTVTELILQHQNPQQLSANLWAAVRARGCQFLGPAMQEDALKLVLLALEDGSALSRKVLVLFVVQKLEGRFPQASKTSIGHVVQLLYRASCFKVTKRDEDSSLMQLKEEFRSYEALRREHDAQIVHIAMEAGLRISPEQWSSLLYGDLLHKSHMQSIIDKLQSTESFAKSVQELTIVLQRTGDPANLTGLRAGLELLANIDHNTDEKAPKWEELENVMLAVKSVVGGLVEFVQNFSKKNNESPQPQVNSKYKTSMCRDLRQQGGCPRGGNCTFAHTQDELEKFRLRNKKCANASHALPSLVGETLNVEDGNRTEESVGVEKDTLTEGSPRPQRIQRNVPSESDSNGLTGPSLTLLGPTEQQTHVSPPRSPARSPLTATGRATDDGGGPHYKYGAAFMLRAPHPSGASELFYPEQQSAYDSAHYHPNCSYYSPTLHSPHKACMARFLRSSNVPESHLPPPTFPSEPQTSPHPHTSSPMGYPPHLPKERIYHHHHHHHPGQPQYGPLSNAHGVYSPLYDTRRVWRPQLYHREDARSNSLPPEVLHSSVYQPPLRERFNSLDGNFCSGSEYRVALHRDYSRVPLACNDLFRRKQEQWAHHDHHYLHHHPHRNNSRPSQGSAIFNLDFRPEHVDSSPGQCVGCQIRGEETLAHFSPWSCNPTVPPCISPFEPEPPTQSTANVEQPESDGSSGTASNSTKHWLHSLERNRRLKEDDPIIPFSEGPIISKWGAISRASRSGYYTTDPIQCQGGAGTMPIDYRDCNSHLDRSEYRWNSRGSDSSSHSSFIESEPFCQHSSNEKMTSDQQSHQECEEPEPTSSERDIELELSALDLEDSDPRDIKSQSLTADRRKDLQKRSFLQ
ncbi:roquin-2 [Stigmatopora nigra]